MQTSNEYRFRKAKERVEAIKSFYSHLAAYVVIITSMAVFNYMTVDFPWVLFPAIGWGAGLFGHWAGTFGYNLVLGKNWEERKINEMMNSGDF